MSIIAEPARESEKFIFDANLIKIRFQFDFEKGKAILEQLLNLVGGHYNSMALLKLAFFADRWHVRNFARPVSCDEYFAMKLGPLPSNIYDIVKSVPTREETRGYDLSLEKIEIDYSLFSESDLEALQFAVDHFAALGHKNPFHLADYTHAFPEWTKWENRFLQNEEGREEMDYRDFLLNADPSRREFAIYNIPDPFELLSEIERSDIIDEMIERTMLTI